MQLIYHVMEATYQPSMGLLLLKHLFLLTLGAQPEEEEEHPRQQEHLLENDY